MDRWNATYDLPSAEPGRRWDPDAQVCVQLTAHGPDAAAARARLDVWLRGMAPLELAPAGQLDGLELVGTWEALPLTW